MEALPKRRGYAGPASPTLAQRSPGAWGLVFVGGLSFCDGWGGWFHGGNSDACIRDRTIRSGPPATCSSYCRHIALVREEILTRLQLVSVAMCELLQVISESKEYSLVRVCCGWVISALGSMGWPCSADLVTPVLLGPHRCYQESFERNEMLPKSTDILWYRWSVSSQIIQFGRCPLFTNKSIFCHLKLGIAWTIIYYPSFKWRTIPTDCMTRVN